MNHPTLVFALSTMAATAAYAVPEVTSCTMSQPTGNKIATIEYTLSETPAVVTLDIQTNNTDGVWTSIGGEHIWNAGGAVWRKVTTDDLQDGKYVITWDPTQSWKDPSGNGFKVDGTSRKARAVVTAWALNNTPDYMVVDISAGASPNTQRYYPAVDFLPGSELGQKGSVTNNTAYRTTSLLMRKIMAKGVRWTKGSVAESGRNANEATYEACLTNNYYIGVFEITQTQSYLIKANYHSQYTAERTMRPADNLSYTTIRGADATWPDPPADNTLLKKLRDKTGIDFDLPSEAEWEFACRAGHGEGYWGDGSPINIVDDVDENLNKLSRYKGNSTITGDDAKVATLLPSEGGTAICGSYKPNSWGLYDMHGNVAEWCLDWFRDADQTLFDQAGAVNTIKIQYNSYRGPRYSGKAGQCRSAARGRDNRGLAGYWLAMGCRVVCRAGLD